jgi:hypothetical protein
LSKAADVGEEKKGGGDAQNEGARVGSSAQRRAIAARREERQQVGEALEKVEAVAQRREAAEAKARMTALVGESGVERKKWTKQERMAWRRMRALGSGGHVPPRATNSEGDSRTPSREVPPHLDSVPFNVTDTDGSRKPQRAHKPESTSGKWPKHSGSRHPRRIYRSL